MHGLWSDRGLWDTPMAVWKGSNLKSAEESGQTFCAQFRPIPEVAVLMVQGCFQAMYSFSSYTSLSNWLERQSQSTPSVRFGLSHVSFWHELTHESLPSECPGVTAQMCPFGQASLMCAETPAWLVQTTYVNLPIVYFFGSLWNT